MILLKSELRMIYFMHGKLYLPSGLVSRCFHSSDLSCNSCKLKVVACNGFILQFANRSLPFSTIDIQLKEKSANNE